MSEITNKLHLPYLMAAQAQKHVTHNDALRLLDDLVQISVVTRGLSTPPTEPEEGASYIIGESALGVWQGKENQLAGFHDGAWIFHAPQEGWLAWVQDDAALYIFTGGEWVLAKADSDGAEIFGVNTIADEINRLSVKSEAVLLSHEETGAGSNADMRLTVNKAGPTDTASLLFQSGFSGRAEMGLAGGNGFSVKVSADGSVWSEALTVDETTGSVSFPNTTISGGDFPPGGTQGQVIAKLSNAANDWGWVDTFTTTPVDAETRHLYERELGALPRRAMNTSYNNGSVSQQADRRWVADVGGDCWFILNLTANEQMSNNVFIELRVDSGNFSDAYVEQMVGNTVSAGSRVDLQLERDRLILRNLTPTANVDGLRIRLRNIGTSQDVRFTAPGVGIGEPATLLKDADLVAMDNLSVDEANSAVDIFSINSHNTIMGSSATVTSNAATVPFGTIEEIVVPLAGRLENGDDYLLLFQASKAFKSISLQPHSGNTGGAGEQGIAEEIGNGWHALRGTVNTGDGLPAAYGNLRIDNRAVAGSAAEEVELSGFWMAKNAVGLPSQLKLPGVVRKALRSLGVSKVYVDVDGDDGSSGDFDSPLATLSEALARGVSRIAFRRHGVHRSGPVNISSSIKFSSYALPGDVLEHAILRFSEPVQVSDMQTTSDPNVYFLARSFDPKGMWMVGEAGLTRLGVPGVNGKNYPATDEIAVQQNVGSWWFGTGSLGEGIYLNPPAGVDGSETYEIPLSNIGMEIGGAEHVEFDQVELSCAAGSVLNVNGSKVEAYNSVFSHSGADDGVHVGGATPSIWSDRNSIFKDAGDDGFGTNGRVTSHSYHSRFIDNVADGFAPHGVNNDCSLDSCELSENGKQGFVSIGQGQFRLQNCTAKSNISSSILVLLNPFAQASSIDLNNCISDSTYLQSDQPDQLVASISNHRGLLHLECDAKVNGLRASGSGDLLTVSAGNAMVQDMHLTGAGRAVRLNGGDLSMSSANLLHSQTGIEIFGGTLELDTAGTVNLFGNGNDFVNVPAAQTSRSVNYPAV